MFDSNALSHELEPKEGDAQTLRRRAVCLTPIRAMNGRLQQLWRLEAYDYNTGMTQPDEHEWRDIPMLTSF